MGSSSSAAGSADEALGAGFDAFDGGGEGFATGGVLHGRVEVDLLRLDQFAQR